MPIGDSKGAFFEDDLRALAHPWYIDPKMEGDEQAVVSPKEMYTNKQLDAAEVDPSTGLGLEIGWKTSSPLVNITDQDVNNAIDVTLGAGAGTIAGVASKTAKSATGWYKGSDGKPRYEISDEGMKLADRDWKFGESGKLSEFVEHPELFKAYPELKDINFKVADKDYKYIGGFDGKTLTINPAQVKAGDEGLLDVITHELQHAIQSKEGFAKGSNPDRALGTALMELGGKIHQATGSAKEELLSLFNDIARNAKNFGEYMYLRTPGEVEANSAAARRKLTDEQRKNIPIKDMEKLFEGTPNSLHGGKYQPEFNYPNP